ncbi:hypothetical protein ACFLVN_01525 [Chloroflexota bacterium]
MPDKRKRCVRLDGVLSGRRRKFICAEGHKAGSNVALQVVGRGGV